MGTGAATSSSGALTCLAELEAFAVDDLQQPSVWDSIPAAGACCWLSDLAGAGPMTDRHDPVAATQQS